MGGPVSAVISTAVYMLVDPFMYLVWSRIYYDSRTRLENVDAAAAAAGVISTWMKAEL